MPQLLYPYEKVRPYTHGMRGLMVLRVGLNIFEKGKISCLARNQTMDPPATVVLQAQLLNLLKPSGNFTYHQV
jgi:hypothetical protein